MALAVVVAIGLALLAMAFTFKQVALAFVAGFTFTGLSIVGWANSTATYDIYWLIGFLGIILLLVCFIMGFLIQSKAVDEAGRQELQDYEEDKKRNPEKYMDEQERYSRELDKMIESAQDTANRAAVQRSQSRVRRRLNRE